MTDIKSIVFDEIALEGLEGITISSLWIRLKQVDEFRLNLDQPATRAYVWKNVVLKFASGNLDFYQLPEERPTITIYNRYDYISQETGYCIHDEDRTPENIYADVCPISSDRVRGSCKSFDSREPIALASLTELSLEQAEQIYGNRLVIVANQKLREHALRIDCNDPLVELTPIQYCIIERCGRCRKLGDLTFGHESGNFKDPPKTLFYFRKLLLKKGLVTKQMHTVYNTKTQSITRGLLLMLPRFHIDRKSPMELAAMKIAELLKAAPNQRSEYFELKAQSQIRNKPFKHIFAEFSKYFRVIDSEESTKASKKARYVELIKPFDEEDGDSSDEEELNEDDKRPAVKEVAKVKLFRPDNIPVNRTMLSQSYQVVKAFSALNGVSLREFQNELFVPRLDARMLIRMLERLNVATTISTNIGRQKVIRYFLKDHLNTTVDRFNNENNQLALGKKATLVTLRRANIILNAVKEHKIIDQLFYFKKIIIESERKLPYRVDQKSVKRILQTLAKEGHVNWIKSTFGRGMYQKRYNLICVPTITEENDIVKERIEQAKFKYYSINHANLLKLPIDMTDENEPSDSTNWSLLANPKADESSQLVYQPSVSRQYGLEPKLKKIITFYKFVFFTLSDECRKDNSFEDNDWRKHITPLPKSYEKDTCVLGDLIPRIPLSVFVKTVFITYVIPGLDDLLKDPVRRHYTLQMLPHDLVKNLFRKRKYIFCMVELLTLLAHLNLVELSSKLLSIKEQVLVRLLKSIEFVEDEAVKKYKLKNLDDVETFVNDLELHGSRIDCAKCSFDSRLYIHNARNWSYQPKFLRNVPANELNRFTRLRDLNDEAMNNLNNLEIDQYQFGPMALFKMPAVKRKAKSKRPTKRQKELAEGDQANDGEDPDDSSKTEKSNRRDADGGLTKRLRRIGYDKADMNALSLLRKQRAEWSKEEDSFLLMCRVASILIHPTSTHFTCVSKHVLRDELFKYLPNLAFDKTSKACQRRLMYMLRNARTRSHVLDWVAEVKQDLEMSFIQKPDVPLTHIEEWAACFVDLLHKLLKKFQNKEHFASPSSQIENFRTLEEIFSTYNLIESEIHCVPQKPILFFQPNNTVDIYVNVVLNVLSSSLLANMFDSDPESSRLTLTLFKIYQRYPDTMIRAVVNKMKINGMIAKVRSSDRQKTKYNKEKKLSMFKISQHYCFVMKSRYCMDTLTVPLDLNDGLTMRDNFGSSEVAFLTNLITMNRALFNINVPENFVSIKDITRNLSDDSPDKTNNSPDKTTSCDASTDALDILANDLWSNDESTLLEGSVSLNSVISHSKRTSRYLLCSLRQRMTLIDKYQLSQDYLLLNKCNIACRISSTDNLVNLEQFLELLKKQRLLIDPNRTVNESSLNSVERAIVREVAKGKELGLTYEQLFEVNPFSCRGQRESKASACKQAVRSLLERQILFEVGVEEVKVIAYKFVMPWLVHAQMLIGDESVARECAGENEATKTTANAGTTNGEAGAMANSHSDERNATESSGDKAANLDGNETNFIEPETNRTESDQLPNTESSTSIPNSKPHTDPQTQSTPAKPICVTEANAKTHSKNAETNPMNQSNQTPTNRPKVIYYLPKFWKTPLGELDKKVMIVLLSGVLGHILANPGITEPDLLSFFKFCLPPVQTLELLDLLTAASCIVKHERMVECNFTLFGGCDTKPLVFYEPTKESFITFCCVKKALSV